MQVQLLSASPISARLVKWYNKCLVIICRVFDSPTEHQFPNLGSLMVEQRPPKPLARVRFPPGVPNSVSKQKERCMSLLEQIKKDRVKARIAKDAVATNVLTTLVGELEGLSKRSGEEVTDEKVVAICKKFIENNDTTIQFSVSVEAVDTLRAENVLLTKYIPAQLTTEELRTIIVAMATSNMGEVMKNLKANHAGLYDASVASKIVKEIA